MIGSRFNVLSTDFVRVTNRFYDYMIMIMTRSKTNTVA